MKTAEALAKSNVKNAKARELLKKTARNATVKVNQNRERHVWSAEAKAPSKANANDATAKVRYDAIPAMEPESRSPQRRRLTPRNLRECDDINPFLVTVNETVNEH